MKNIKDKFFPLVIILLAAFIVCATACKKEPKKYVIAVINPNERLNVVADGFKSELTGYGYVEGENTTYIYIYNAEDVDPGLQGFKDKKVDLIFALTTPATIKAKTAMEGTGIPVIFGTSFDPVKGGIIKRLVHQEENITGIKVGGNTQKALEWLLRITPEAKRIFVPVKFDTEAASLSLAELKEAAAKLSVDLIVSNVETAKELKSALSTMPQDVDAVFIINSILIASHIDRIVDASIKFKLPVGAATAVYKNGAIISYSQLGERSGGQAARLAHKTLQGTPASLLPVETADFFLGINLKTAEAIGLKIPNDILVQADFIVR